VDSIGEAPVVAEDGRHEKVGKAMVINSQGEILAEDDRISRSLVHKKPSMGLQKASMVRSKASKVRQAPVAAAVPAAPVAPAAAAAAPAVPAAATPAIAAPAAVAAPAAGAAPAATAPAAAAPAAAAPAAAAPAAAAPAAAAPVAPAVKGAAAAVAPAAAATAAGAPAETAPAAQDASSGSATVTYMFLIFTAIGIISLAVAVYQQRKNPANSSGRLGQTAGSADEGTVAWRTSKARSTYRKAVLDKSDGGAQGTDDTEEDDATTKKSKGPSGSDRENVGSSTGGSASRSVGSYRDRRLMGSASQKLPAAR